MFGCWRWHHRGRLRRAAALRGLRVIICEPGPDPAAASAASAGILGPQIERADEACAPWDSAPAISTSLAPHWRDHRRRHRVVARRDRVLAFDESEAERLRDAVRPPASGGTALRLVGAEEVAERVPRYRAPAWRDVAPEDGAVDAPALAARSTRRQAPRCTHV